MTNQKVAIVTGDSSGIGRATAVAKPARLSWTSWYQVLPLRKTRHVLGKEK